MRKTNLEIGLGKAQYFAEQATLQQRFRNELELLKFTNRLAKRAILFFEIKLVDSAPHAKNTRMLETFRFKMF